MSAGFEKYCLSCHPTLGRLSSGPAAPAQEARGDLWQILASQWSLTQRTRVGGQDPAGLLQVLGPGPGPARRLALQEVGAQQSRQLLTAARASAPGGGLGPGPACGPGSPPSVHELSVALGPGDNDVHPDAHGLCRRGHHVVQPVVRLHAEGEGRVRALRRERGAAKTGPPRRAAFSCPPRPVPMMTWSSGMSPTWAGNLDPTSQVGPTLRCSPPRPGSPWTCHGHILPGGPWALATPGTKEFHKSDTKGCFVSCVLSAKAWLSG